MSTPFNEHAFPVPSAFYTEGMSLRDYFAAKAINGMIAEGAIPRMANAAQKGEHCPDDEKVKEVVSQVLAQSAYLIADAMLKARQAK